MADTVLKKFDMTGKTAIVTGAAGLLGKQFSLTLAQAAPVWFWLIWMKAC